MNADLASLYSEVFSPEYYLLVCTLAVVAFEWRAGGDDGRVLSRVGVVAVAWVLAFAIYQSAPLLFDSVPVWGEDLTGGLGLAAAFALIGAVWTVREWGRVVPELAALVVAVSVAHSLVTPFWDVSSHVLYTAVPTGYLAVLDRRALALVVVPLGMVVSRPLAGEHTWLQSVAGGVLALVFVVGVVTLSGVSERRADARTNEET